MDNNTPAQHEAAIQEGERIAAIEDYFWDRMWLKTPDNVKLFETGFDRAYALLSKLRAPVADERDAARYRVLRSHTAPLRLAESMGIPRKQVKRSDDPAARVDEMCDAALASAPVAGEAQITNTEAADFADKHGMYYDMDQSVAGNHARALLAAYAAPQASAMPRLNDAMRALIENQGDIYQSPEALYEALCNAAFVCSNKHFE